MPLGKDLTNQVFNRLTVIERCDYRVTNHIRWHCQCECGNTIDVDSSQLTRNRVKSCGCLRIEKGYDTKVDLTDKRYGRLLVLSDTGKRTKISRAIIWLCQCDCGKTKEISASNLSKGTANSCVCLREENTYKYFLRKRNIRIVKGIKITKEYRYTIDKFIKEYRKTLDGKCVVCGSKRKIHLHHLWGVNYKPELAMEPENLVQLCKACHNDFHMAYYNGMNTPLQFVEFYETYL